MNPIRLILLLFLLFSFTPWSAIANPSLQGFDPSPIHEEERIPITDMDSIQNGESPTVVAQQKGAEGEKVPQEGSDEREALNGEEKEEESQKTPDPLRPLNKVMFQFNDKLYFWLLKPVTQVYVYVAPEPCRMLFSNFFDNLKAPARFVNHLLQGRMKEAGNEFVRFAFNSTAGLGGLADAAKELLHIRKTPSDFGQTLGHCGIDHGFYLVLPVFGASSLRDGVGLAVDQIMYPLSYISFTNISFEASAGIFVFETVNDTSFHIGDYEAFKQAAIDPYVSMRDAYFQNRKKALEK
jgi:phospholipid-binding lipoprotein MlaA